MKKFEEINWSADAFAEYGITTEAIENACQLYVYVKYLEEDLRDFPNTYISICAREKIEEGMEGEPDVQDRITETRFTRAPRKTGASGKTIWEKPRTSRQHTKQKRTESRLARHDAKRICKLAL